MKAVRIHPSQGSTPYSPSNPAPPSALHIDRIPIPAPSQPGQVLIEIRTSTIIRDALTWPESYAHPYIMPGNDLAGVVVETTPDSSSRFKPGDEVFGMLAADRPGSWAEFALVKEGEIALKPASLSWEEAAALPLSGITAYEAVFGHGGVCVPHQESILKNLKERKDDVKRVLVTGAAGAVGTYVVQLARFAGLHVTAATRSNVRDGEFLGGLGVDEFVEYPSLKDSGTDYDIVIDTVGGQPLIDAWKCIKSNGNLITVDSSSFDFVSEHKKLGVWREDVMALFFIVEGSSEALEFLGKVAGLGVLRIFVSGVHPLDEVREAYEVASGRNTRRGKVVLSIA